MTRAKVVTLVPWRGGEPRREWCWDVTRPSLEALGYPLFTGDAPGPWARAAACNNAAKAAGDWEVALFADCDTIPDPTGIERAVAWVRGTRGAARPHAERWMTTQEGALVLAQRGPQALNYESKARPKHIGPMFKGGGLLVIHREAFDRVGGYDEEFVGWGYEDSAMNLSLLVKATWDRLPGHAWHLWHGRLDNAPRQESVNRYRQLIRENRSAIDRWAANQGLIRPQEIF